jgi:hypothetical protein
MDEREANIDLVFRNGLKDYEVLPPCGVWNRIAPVIRKRQKPYIIIRAAATLAVLLTLGFLASTWNGEAPERTSAYLLPEPGNGEAVNPQRLILADANTASRAGNIPVSYGGEKLTPEPETVTIAPSASQEAEFSQPVTASLNQSSLGTDRPKLIPLNKPVSQTIAEEGFPVLFADDGQSAQETKKWTIAALISPTYMSNMGNAPGVLAEQVRSAEQPVVSYGGGIALSYKLSKRFSLQSGLYYSSFENQLSGITTFGGYRQYDQTKGNVNFKMQTSNGMVLVSNPDIYLVDNLSGSRLTNYHDKGSFDQVKSSLEYLGSSLQQNMSYLELPLILRYKLVDRALGFNIVGGLSSNFLVNNSVYASLDGEKLQIAETEDLRQLIMSSSIGMGFEYSLGKGVSFNFEPTFRYFLNPSNGTGSISLHPYSIGIFSGLSYKF